ncbi:hypothetical protein CHS0354_008968 [Potamilus streckersoni]|uniref:Cadherin domain-containing protein n=1 Tax=Potamilus streckersoni TaxID=2493646 RepID=A0AAE0TIC7_9BIVA|nr:hypothetical protein CHS0354_008968 [Potamilus streckersoni]
MDTKARCYQKYFTVRAETRNHVEMLASAAKITHGVAGASLAETTTPSSTSCADSLEEEKISQATGLSEPVKEKEKRDTKAPIPVAEVLSVSGFLTVRPQMMIGMNLLEKPDSKVGEKLQSCEESKPSPDARDEPRPQGQLKSVQVGLPEPSCSSKLSCWDSYARDHRSIPMAKSHNLLQKSITSRSSHIPGESRSRPQNSLSTAGDTQGQDGGFTPEDLNYVIINREFQDRAIDLATGNVFEFNTRTNKRSVSDGTTIVYANLTVNIEDENDEVPIITGDLTATIPENFSVGSPLPEMFVVTDGDAGDYITYNLSGAHTSFFQVNSITGEIITIQHLDYEGGVTLFEELLLTVTDTLGNSANATLFIYLIDVNDNVPTFNQSAYSISIDEESHIGMDIIQLTATDKDSIFNLSYAIVSIDPFGFFVFDNTTNMLKVSKIINLDVPDNHPASFHLVVIAMDGGTPELTGTVYVNILISQVNEYAPVFGETLPNNTVEVRLYK